MRSRATIPALLTLTVLAFTASVFAQAPQQGVTGRLALYGTTAETVLKAPALSGSPKFTNNGSYWGLTGELSSGRLTVYGMYQTGKAKRIAGGELMPPAPTFQPLTGERSDVVDVAIGYTVVDSAATGKLDVFGGYYRLWAEPMISPANWYDGAQVGIKGRKQWPNGIALNYKVGYVPNYTVNGYVHKSLAQDDIWLFRAAGELPVYDKVFLTGGYQFMRLEAVATANKTPAVVTFGGFFLGGGYRF